MHERWNLIKCARRGGHQHELGYDTQNGMLTELSRMPSWTLMKNEVTELRCKNWTLALTWKKTATLSQLKRDDDEDRASYSFIRTFTIQIFLPGVNISRNSDFWPFILSLRLRYKIFFTFSTFMIQIFLYFICSSTIQKCLPAVVISRSGNLWSFPSPLPLKL